MHYQPAVAGDKPWKAMQYHPEKVIMTYQRINAAQLNYHHIQSSQFLLSYYSQNDCIRWTPMIVRLTL